MKQGHRYLFNNGRGNYGPVSLYERQLVKQCERRLREDFYDYKRGGERTKQWDLSTIRAHKHGVGLRQLRKGLNSKLRHLAKQQIRKELENYE